MSEAKEVVRRIEEAWARDDVAAVEGLVAADIVNHDAPPGFPSGLEGAKAGHAMFMASFPDRSVSIEELIGDGDLVAVRTVVRGTHTGAPFLGAPAAGKKIQIEGISLYRVAGGKAVEHWGLNDGIGLLMQLGMMSAPAPA
jgi:predicted ester cyclase